jgi:glucans biosynthesis protein
VENLARLRASRPFQAPPPKEKEKLGSIGEREWRDIEFREDRRLWAEEGLDFEISLYHPGFIYDQPAQVTLVEEGRSRQVPFSPNLFEYRDPGLAVRYGDGPGFAGFAVWYPINDPGTKERTFVFLGASHFQALARHADFGQTARGLILHPGEPGGEEFPYFRQFWLIKPKPGEREMTVLALMESPSLTGAYNFLLKPGPTTLMEVRAVLFRREGAEWPKTVGLAPASAMYLFSEKENGSPYDWRPEVHSAEALLWSPGPGQWLHRPLNNPRRLFRTFFAQEGGIAGFGLIQKDNAFDHYQDFGSRYERRSWLWAEPVEGFDSGRLELLEIPSSREIHDNVQSFWALPTQSLSGVSRLSARYRLYWMPPGSTPHQLGRVVSTRLLSLPDQETAEFIIDFENSLLNSIPSLTGLASQVETDELYPVLEKRLVKNPITGGWRLRFKMRAPQGKGLVDNLLSGRESYRPPPRVRAWLLRGENLPEALTETFVYDFPQ